MIARLLLAALLLHPPLLAAAPTFSIDGAVDKPGTYNWQPGVRLLDASVTAQVNPDAWYMGATLQRESAKLEQRKLKVGLLFDLRSAKVRSRLSHNPEAQALIEQLIAQVQAMPVTGRVMAEMNPLKQRLIRHNPLLEAGDSISYAHRPSSITVTGAVQATCQLAYSYTATPYDYLAACPAHPLASADSLFLIQPDGAVIHLGSGHWNQQTAPVAVGATLLVPVSEAVLTAADEPETFNEDMAAFIATQTPAQERAR
ncbi:capsule biosynthesis GfcC D2 domain-containing protein [Halopseudomonas maritima]|uniref:capsule biosynthesis GfcC D2 domain-containing protein n=1 Tax=Halopseudomonas maritima TaxID=2918528 RepID=UPI001EEB43E2|nr:capsule biosynthesis GfcC D2 domain-containing protein [Halopseudomonas maritima]UJJ32065.1 capsule biosynthesis GfcC family protein [Halopseudomonas maritima]